MDNVVKMRPAGPPCLPDPTPYVLNDVRAAIDHFAAKKNLSLESAFEQVAAAVNQACGIDCIRGHVVGRWYRGKAEPLASYARVLWWLGGVPVRQTLADSLAG